MADEDKELVRVARALASQHGDADALFVSGEPYRVSIPGGFGYMLDLQHARPLWTAYIHQARVAIDLYSK